MKPIFVRPLSTEEKTTIEASLQESNPCMKRRCQILLASADQHTPTQIATILRCSTQTVRNTIHAFEQTGVASLPQGSSVPITVAPVLTAEKRERLRAMLHQTPRNFGKASSVWTLKLLAEVCREHGLSERPLSAPTILDAVLRLGVTWKRAKHWVVSPDPQYALKKTAGSVNGSRQTTSRPRARFRG